MQNIINQKLQKNLPKLHCTAGNWFGEFASASQKRK